MADANRKFQQGLDKVLKKIDKCKEFFDGWFEKIDNADSARSIKPSSLEPACGLSLNSAQLASIAVAIVSSVYG